MASHAAAEGDVFTQQRQSTQRICFTVTTILKTQELPQQEPQPWSQPGKRPTADCCRQQTPSYSGILALFWFEWGPTPDFLPNETLKELHASCNSVRPCKLASGREVQSLLGGSSMYSKVTLACALKGDDKSRLKQLFKCKYSGSSLFHFSTVKDSVFVFIDGSLFFSCLLSRQLDTGEEVQHI